MVAYEHELHVQPRTRSHSFVKAPLWMNTSKKVSDVSHSPELDTEQPRTPSRLSSASNSKAALQTQYSESDDSSDELQQLRQPCRQLSVPAHAPALQASAKAHQEQEQWSSAKLAMAVVVACATWILVSSSTILINKYIMVDLSFHFPAAVSALGMFGTTVASFLACCVFKVVPCQATVSPFYFFTHIMTTGFLIALSFQAGNTAYLYLSVAFVQMLKAFTPVSTMVCGFIFGLEKPSAKLIMAVCCISFGVVVSSFGELNFSTFGVVAMLTSISAEGLRTALMQHLLSSKQFHPLEAWMYLGPACIIWLVLLIGVTEARDISNQHALDIVVAHKWYFACAALAGFAVNSLAMLVIKLASALTLKVLGICKDVGLVLLGVLMLGEHVAGVQVCGYSISLLGFAAYNYIKAAGAVDRNAGLLRYTNSKSKHDVTRQDSMVYISSSAGRALVSRVSSGSLRPIITSQHTRASFAVRQPNAQLLEPLLSTTGAKKL